MAKEIKHTICFRCKPRCRLELEVEDNQIVNGRKRSILSLSDKKHQTQTD